MDDPVIIATITTAAGEPAGPLLIDGCHRLYKAAVTGVGLPAVVLTAAETLSIRTRSLRLLIGAHISACRTKAGVKG
jgi:hypothetical protein